MITRLRDRFILMFCLSASAAIGQTTIVTYTGTADLFPNPERGFYNHREVQAEGAALTVNGLLSVRNQNRSLILRMYYLRSFRSSDLSTAQLNLIATDLGVMRTAGVKCILRFAYSRNETDPDAPLATITRHLDQLKPLLEANRDVIAVMQAGFIGAWGEWYYSSNGLNNTTNRRAVLQKILEVLPKGTQVQVRTPNYKQDIFSITLPLTPDEAYTGTDVARTAHHNDCFLASYDDYGTYQDTAADKAYLSADTRYTAMGGETCAQSSFSGCANALSEMARMHWTFLNADYNSIVLTSWKQVVPPCYEEVDRRLGYRFELARGAYRDAVRPGGEFTAELALLNRGFAAPFNGRPVELVLRNVSDATVYTAQLPVDPRFWHPADTIRVTASAGIPPDMPQGTYELLLHLHDPAPALEDRPEYAIRLANEGVWESATGYNKLGVNVLIDPSASGSDYTDTLYFKRKTPTGVDLAPPSLHPGGIAIVRNYPNPFNGATRITYWLPTRDRIAVRVYSMLGELVMTLVSGEQEVGEHNVYLSGADLASGVYLCRLEGERVAAVTKMVLLK